MIARFFRFIRSLKESQLYDGFNSVSDDKPNDISIFVQKCNSLKLIVSSLGKRQMNRLMIELLFEIFAE